MKTLKYLGFFLTAMFFFIACSKELSLETGFSGGNAVGYLGSVAGQCDTNIVRGQYVRDSVLNDSNYVLVDVTFQSPGLYKIITETENGFSFADSGYMINTGLQRLKLKAVGRPVAKGNTSFLVTFDTSFCSFTVAVDDTPNTRAIIVPTPGGCGALFFTDTFKVGQPLNINRDFISTKVNVLKQGSYTISTTPRNGMFFSATGVFNNIGNSQTLVLRGNGTPLNAGKDTVFFIVNGDTACAYAFVVLPKPSVGPTTADSAWQFNQGTPFYYGSIDSAKIDSIPFVTGGGVIRVPGVGIWGRSYATGDSSFFIGVPLTADTVKLGDYNSSQLINPAAFLFHKTPSTASVIYTASFLDVGVNTKVTVLSYNKVTKIITGIFTGTARNATLTPVPITNGKFTAKIR